MSRTVERILIEPRGPFRLDASIGFLAGFPPAGMLWEKDRVLRIAFTVDGTEDVAGVDIRQAEPDGPVSVGVTTAAPMALVERQVARLLSLDHDGRRFPDVGRRDPVIGALQDANPGFRPTGFWSPFEAAAWAITSHRIQMAQAARVKAAIARQFGTVVHHDGHDLHAFPAPAALAGADLTTVPGLGGRKPEWLRGIGFAAIDGRLDADALRSVAAPVALASLRRLAGVGPFSAELILIRGAMTIDVAPANEGRLDRAMAVAYGPPEGAGLEELAGIIDGWAPFRTWASVLVRSSSGSHTHRRPPATT